MNSIRFKPTEDVLREFWSNDSFVNIVEQNIILPSPILFPNYPNPFNSSTTIKYTIPENCLVNLTVYDVLGREVTQLVDNFQTAGNHNVLFHGDNLSSGIYYYRLQVEEYLITEKMLYSGIFADPIIFKTFYFCRSSEKPLKKSHAKAFS